MNKFLQTKKGYDFYEVSSALQKAIRRGETAIAGYFAFELLESGYHLSQAPKNRDADHLTNLVYDTGVATEEAEKFLKELDSSEVMDIPDYAFDCHTAKGKRKGKTRKDFFKEEFEALKPRQKGLFDEYVPK